ncbi:hypothetical protein LJR153_001998 [Paenibacillus sp. LjRoot153]|uniref:hypothetical protein n=1 Tax=Paenibacillus sp. LjRoot153 TaxID=3342270 RepID=UPI003ECF70AC
MNRHNHVILEGKQPLAGFAAEDSSTGNDNLKVLVNAFVHSDQKEFYGYVKQISDYYLNSFFSQDNILSFLILAHKDGTTDIYVNDIPLVLNIVAKKKINSGDTVFHSDIVDIQSLTFDNITISEDDIIIYCFKKGWKFGLYFDFRQIENGHLLNIHELSQVLGKHYRYLSFQEEYSILENQSLFNIMMEDGWFPFIQLVGGEYERISKAYLYKEKASEIFSILINEVVDKYDSALILSISTKWCDNEVFNEKGNILSAGIEAFLTNTPSGYINCIKTLYTEIEGIVRISFHKEFGNKPTTKDLMKFIQDKGVNKFLSEYSLAFPSLFYQYLDQIIFKGFNLSDNEVDLSRHSTSHGVAKSDDYTKIKALQAILVLDQMYYYLK